MSIIRFSEVMTNRKNPMREIIEGFKGVFTTKGNMSRRAFWYYYLFVCFVNAMIHLLLSSYQQAEKAGFIILNIGLFLQAICYLMTATAKVRRLHDTGFSGYWILIEYVLLGFLVWKMWLISVTFALGGVQELFRSMPLVACMIIIYGLIKIFTLCIFCKPSKTHPLITTQDTQ